MNRFLSANDDYARRDLSNVTSVPTYILQNELGSSEGGSGIPVSEKGTPLGVATLDGSGLVPSSQISSLHIADVHTVANIAARDALIVQEGDTCKVTDSGIFYIYDGLAWIELSAGPSTTAMTDLTDTNITSIQNNQFLKYNSTSGKYENVDYNFADMNDVAVGGVLNNEYLVYNGGGFWAPQVPIISDNSDVLTTTPANNDALLYNTSNTRFENRPILESDITNLTADLAGLPGAGTFVLTSTIQNVSGSSEQFANFANETVSPGDFNIAFPYNVEIFGFSIKNIHDDPFTLNSGQVVFQLKKLAVGLASIDANMINIGTTLTLDPADAGNYIFKSADFALSPLEISIGEGICCKCTRGVVSGLQTGFDTVITLCCRFPALNALLPSSINVSDLTDTNITSVANDNVLRYNSTASKWENQTMTGSDVTYDNATSGLVSTNVQSAIDEVVTDKQDNVLTTKGDLLAYDTSVNRLAVGTNGQILSSNSVQGTGLEWINAPSSSVLTTKGDIATYSTSDARLAVGTNGQTLIADSAETTGLKWAGVDHFNYNKNGNEINNAILKFNSGAGQWRPELFSLSSFGESIKSLSDVWSSMTPTDGQALVYSTSNVRWEAGTVGGGGGSTLDSMTDTDLTGKLNNNVLTYNSTSTNWEPAFVDHINLLNGGTTTHANLDTLYGELLTTRGLDTLFGVSIPTTPTTNHVLTFNGSNWVAQVAPGAGGGATIFDELTDCTISTSAENHSLIYEGSAYINRQLKSFTELTSIDDTPTTVNYTTSPLIHISGPLDMIFTPTTIQEENQFQWVFEPLVDGRAHMYDDDINVTKGLGWQNGARARINHDFGKEILPNSFTAAFSLSHTVANDYKVYGSNDIADFNDRTSATVSGGAELLYTRTVTKATAVGGTYVWALDAFSITPSQPYRYFIGFFADVFNTNLNQIGEFAFHWVSPSGDHTASNQIVTTDSTSGYPIIEKADSTSQNVKYNLDNIVTHEAYRRIYPICRDVNDIRLNNDWKMTESLNSFEFQRADVFKASISEFGVLSCKDVFKITPSYCSMFDDGVSAQSTTNATPSTWEIVPAGSGLQFGNTIANFSDFANVTNQLSMTYTGTLTRNFIVNCSMSVYKNSTGLASIGLYKNSTRVGRENIGSSTEEYNISFNTIVNLATNDIISIWQNSATASETINWPNRSLTITPQ